MDRLQQEIAKVLFRISNMALADYYGVSPNPLHVEKKLLDQKAKWISGGWYKQRDIHLTDLKLNKLPKLNDKNQDSIYVENNDLTTLNNSPSDVLNFYCDNNPRLRSLHGAPPKIWGSFSCENCGLSSLKGGPLIVKGDYDCRKNKLVSLDGAPAELGGYMLVDSNVDRNLLDEYPHINVRTFMSRLVERRVTGPWEP